MKTTILFILLTLFAAACEQKASLPQNNAVPAPTVENAAPSNVASDTSVALDSVYLPIGEKTCQKRKPAANSGAIVEMVCPGAGGYKVKMASSDHSAEFTLVDAAGKETDLDLRRALDTVADFMPDDKIEWRMDGKDASAKARAMVFRVNKFTDPVDKSKNDSMLVVVRLAGERPCVTDVIPPSADQNAKAREAADAAERPCLVKKP